MKTRLFLLLLSITISYNGFSQYGIKELPLSKDFRLVRLNYENKSGEIAFTIFEYDEMGYLTKATWKHTDDRRSGVITYKYDSTGNLIGQYRIFSDSITISQTFEYSSTGNLLFDNFQRSDGTIGKVEFIYNENDKLVQANCNKQNGWFSGILNYEYNDNKQLVKAKILQQDEEIGSITYSYNKIGLIDREYWDFPERWNQTFTYEYKRIGDLQK